MTEAHVMCNAACCHAERCHVRGIVRRACNVLQDERAVMRMLMCQFWRDVLCHAANSRVAENILLEAVQGRASGAALLNNITCLFVDEKGCCLPRRKLFWHGYMFWITQLPAAECIDLFGLDEMCWGQQCCS